MNSILFFLLLLVIPILFLTYFFWNTTRVQKEWVQVGIRNLPPAFAGYRIAHISDLHLELNFIAKRVVSEWLSQVQPDLIVITGDCAETFRGVRKARNYLDGWSAKDGILAVFGNHEYDGSRKMRTALKEVYNELGIKLLMNQNIRIERGEQALQVVGVDDYCTSHDQFELAFAGCERTIPTLLLCHDPNMADDLPEQCVDYALGGHFHGGQINLPWTFRFHPMGDLPDRGIVAGAHNIRGIKWYISRGLGQVGFPFRFRALPELILHELILESAE